MRIFDVVMIGLFVLFMIFMVVGFNKQMLERHKEREEKNLKKDRNKNEVID